MSRTIWVLIPIALLSMNALGQGSPTVRTVKYESFTGGLEKPNGDSLVRSLQPMPEDRYSIQGDVYRSRFNRMNIKIPRIGEETFVDVRESVTMLRADGSPATTHVIFDPGGTPIIPAAFQAVSAVVVTRLREDRSKDGNIVLDGIDGGPQGRAIQMKSGFEYAFNSTEFGPAMRRIIPNRLNHPRFPYGIQYSNTVEVSSFGVTVYLVADQDSFIEFSQIFPCEGKGESECREGALNSINTFAGGMTQFRSYPKPTNTSPEESPSVKVE